MKYEPQAPNEKYLDKYNHDPHLDNDYFDFRNIYDFKEDIVIA